MREAAGFRLLLQPSQGLKLGSLLDMLMQKLGMVSRLPIHGNGIVAAPRGHKSADNLSIVSRSSRSTADGLFENRLLALGVHIIHGAAAEML